MGLRAPALLHDSDQGDTTGQIQPPGGTKPRVTATLWEDEATLCFQIETNGICVARREDNHMINGTKLLNVAGMTRGKRDGMLKGEKNRTVVKIGPMHLKGVWIPFDRALELANKEKITERLYPLFVHNLNALLFHNQNNPASMAGIVTTAGSLQARPPTDDYPTPASSMHPSSGPTPNPQLSAGHQLAGRPGMPRSSTMSSQNQPGHPGWADYQMGTATAPDNPRPYSHSAHPSYSSYGSMAPPMRLANDAGAVQPGVNHPDDAEYVHATGPYAQPPQYGTGASSAPRTAYSGRDLPSSNSLHALIDEQQQQAGGNPYLNGAGGYTSPDSLKRKRTLDDEAPAVPRPMSTHSKR